MENKIDLLIVEDNTDERESYERAAKRARLSFVSFESGLKALSYVRGRVDNLPRAYLVDMRTGGSDEIEELASPLELFRFLEGFHQVEYFRFHTGHFSDHDKEIQGITDAQIILKGEPEFYVFLGLLKSMKRSS